MSEAREAIKMIQQKMQERLAETTGMPIGESKDEAPKGVSPAPIAAEPVESVTKPVKANAKEVIYQAPRKVYNFMFKGKQVSFLHGWLKTDDPELIAHIDKHYPKFKKVD